MLSYREIPTTTARRVPIGPVLALPFRNVCPLALPTAITSVSAAAMNLLMPAPSPLTIHLHPHPVDDAILLGRKRDPVAPDEEGRAILGDVRRRAPPCPHRAPGIADADAVDAPNFRSGERDLLGAELLSHQNADAQRRVPVNHSVLHAPRILDPSHRRGYLIGIAAQRDPHDRRKRYASSAGTVIRPAQQRQGFATPVRAAVEVQVPL